MIESGFASEKINEDRIKENNNRDKTPFMSIIKFISPLGYLSDDS